MIVLYVDPNVEVRIARSALLAQLGLTIHGASDAETAVEMAQKCKHLDLLLCEGFLGGGYSGFDLRDAIRQKFPQLSVVYTSRYELASFEELIEGCPVLYEPLDESHFVDVVRSCVCQPRKTEVEPPPQELPEPEVSQQSLPETPSLEPVLAEGTILGNYLVKERLYTEKETETYVAIQQAVQREVALVLLRPGLQADPTAVAAFEERERVKASISHPRIAPLYEAQRVGGYMFYTREMPHGRTLDRLQADGRKLSEKILTDVLAGIAEAMSFAAAKGYYYRMLTPRDVSVDEEHQASIVNVFRPDTGKARHFQSDVQRLLTMFRPLCEGPRARHLLDDLAHDKPSWDELLKRLRDFQEQYRERSLLKRADTKEAQEIKAAAHATGRRLRWLGATAGLVGIGGMVALVVRSRPAQPPLPLKEVMVLVKAGPATYQNGQKGVVNDFWIDKYEITIGQYAEFLAALEADSGRKLAFDSLDQPKTKTNHKPEHWDEYYAAAKEAGLLNQHRIDVNCPVVGVDYWDAFAFAKWRGHRLPSEVEWEKAARGEDDRHYPWGNEAHRSDDPVPAKGKGLKHYISVNKIKDDVSPYGVVGLASYVEEWTGTWLWHPDLPDLSVPVLKGGPHTLNTRDFPRSADDATMAFGFRTVSDQPPAESKP